MRQKILGLLAMATMLAGVAMADSLTPVDLLDTFGISDKKPVEGEIWELRSPSCKVVQVAQAFGGVLATRRVVDQMRPQKNFFVKTKRSYADEDILATGYYRVEGTKTFEMVDGGSCTIYVFSELPQDEQRKISEFMQDKAAVAAAQQLANEERRRQSEQTAEFKKSKERIAAEEAAEKARLERERIELENRHEIAKLEAEKDNRVAKMNQEAEIEANLQKAENAKEMARLAREREEQDKENRMRIAAAKAEKRQADAKLAVEVQKERERYAMDALSLLDFNFKHHYIMQRSIRKNVSIKVADPLWDKLADLQAKQDWLGMLGAIDDEELDEFPSEKEIDITIASLRSRLFKIIVDAVRPPSQVSIWAGRVMDSHQSKFIKPNEIAAGWRSGVIIVEDQINKGRMYKGKSEPVVYVDLLGEKKFYVCDGGSENGKPVLLRGMKAGEKRQDDFEEMAAEAEEWLKAN